MTTDEPRKPGKKTKSAIAEMATKTLLDSRRLFYFYHVAKCGSFTVAETLLDVAQSAMTRQIQQLEADIGAQLLQRTGRGVILTTHGQILFRHAESILNNMSDAIEEIDLTRRNPSGRLSIATPPTFSSLYMPEVIKRMLASVPDLQLTVLEASTGQVHDYLASGEVDLAIVLHAPKTQKVVLKKISSEPLCLMVHQRHPMANEAVAPRARLRDLEIVLPANGHGSRQLIDQYTADGGIDIDAALQIDSLAITKALVAQGERFCTILPRMSCKAEIDSGLLKAVPLKPALHRTLYLARMRDRPESPYAAAIAETIMNVVAQRLQEVEPEDTGT